MGRAPCCEKVGLNRGPWTKEEDQVLINYINENGQANWRALPKKAGLLRCGKSCRLRWINYLRPDIKRGNFTKEEEDAILHLHQELGNKWSAIAMRLPGRTDNEIKNVWHTHIKKRLDNLPQETKRQRNGKQSRKDCKSAKDDVSVQSVKNHSAINDNMIVEETISPSKSSQKMSTSVNSSASTVTKSSSCTSIIDDTLEKSLEVDDDFWADVLSGNVSNLESADHLPQVNGIIDTEESQNNLLLPTSPVLFQSLSMAGLECFDPNKTQEDEMDFWCDYLTTDGELKACM